MKVFCALLLVFAISLAEKARFDNYRVYEIFIENTDQLNALRLLHETSDAVIDENEKNKLILNFYLS